MASKRMFSIDIANEDKFVEMPATAQALYFHLGLRADDEGFVGSCKQLIRGLGFQTGDLKTLMQEGYIIAFETGVIVITDWNTYNNIRKDRIKETRYQDEKIKITQQSGKYQLLTDDANQTSTDCQPDDNQVSGNCPSSDNQMSAQVSIGKYSIDKYNTNCASKNALNEFFESIWSKYPNKRGKGQVSNKQKKKLFGIGYEQMSLAIDRYLSELEKDGWRKPQNGSTFFNSGYVDYLDAHWKGDNCDNEESPTLDLTPEEIEQLRRM